MCSSLLLLNRKQEVEWPVIIFIIIFSPPLHYSMLRSLSYMVQCVPEFSTNQWFRKHFHTLKSLGFKKKTRTQVWKRPQWLPTSHRIDLLMILGKCFCICLMFNCLVVFFLCCSSLLKSSSQKPQTQIKSRCLRDWMQRWLLHWLHYRDRWKAELRMLSFRVRLRLERNLSCI